MDQSLQDSYIFGEGVALEVSLDEEASWSNMGVFEGGVVATHNYDKVLLEPGNKGKTCTRTKNETVAIAPTPLITWDMENVSKLSGGIYTYTAVAGTPVIGASQTASSGAWGYNDFILIENQNADLAAVSITTVTGGTNGLLVADTDYYVGTNEKGESGIFIIDSATVTTEAQDMVIVYDYTPATGKLITSGTSTVTISRYVARLRHYTDAALTTYDIEMKIYGTESDAGIAFNYKGLGDDGANNITVALTGNVDTSKTSGAQLFELFIANTALVSC